MNVFENADGSTTLGYSTGFDRATYEAVAAHIATTCKYAEVARLEVSAKLSAEQINELEMYLAENRAVRQADEPFAHGVRHRWTGETGDTLSINVFVTGTTQFQGRHLQLATLVWDYLTNVLSLDDVLSKQIAMYNVPITVAQIKSELEGRIPVAHGKLHEEIRKQLSTSIGWSKVDIPLEDYSAAASPALRGLEGFIYQELRAAGLSPAEKAGFGDYFESKNLSIEMRPAVAEMIAEPKTTLLTAAYALYHKERHGLAHMSSVLAGTRTLSTMEEAIYIINNVFSHIEDYYRNT